jgi:hypothetical protein
MVTCMRAGGGLGHLLIMGRAARPRRCWSGGGSRETVRRGRVLFDVDRVAAAYAVAGERHPLGGFAVPSADLIVERDGVRAGIAHRVLVGGGLGSVSKLNVQLGGGHRGILATRQ